MEPRLLDGKVLGVFLIAETPGEEEDQYFSFEGVATWDGQQLAIVSSDGKPPFLISVDSLSRIKPVDANMRLVFDAAEFYVPMLARPLPENPDLSRLVKTGYHLPIDEESESSGA